MYDTYWPVHLVDDSCFRFDHENMGIIWAAMKAQAPYITVVDIFGTTVGLTINKIVGWYESTPAARENAFRFTQEREKEIEAWSEPGWK